MRIINFSGGRSSALMTILEYKEGDLVLFTDTLREHKATYDFIDAFEKNENIPITRISFEGGFRGLLTNRKYKILPNRTKRICTVELKIETAKRYVRKNYGAQNYDWLVGFRYDEERRVKDYDPRVKYLKPYFPLYERKISKDYVNNYWKNKGYGLQIPHILGNCTLCFLKGKNALISIMREYPELAKEWIEDEKLTNRTYLSDISYSELLSIAQNNLFKDYQLETIEPAFNCSCTT